MDSPWIAAGDNTSGQKWARHWLELSPNSGKCQRGNPVGRKSNAAFSVAGGGLFGAAALNFRCVSVNRLPKIHAPFWPGVFFQCRGTLGLARLAPAFHQRRAVCDFIRICSGCLGSCRYRLMRSRRCRRRSRLRRRRKLDRLFSVEIPALRACSENECKRQSE